MGMMMMMMMGLPIDMNKVGLLAFNGHGDDGAGLPAYDVSKWSFN